MTSNTEPKDGSGGPSIRQPIESPQNETLTSSSTPVSRGDGEVKGQKEISVWRKIYVFLTWTPPNCRWDPKKPPQFSMSMNVLFAFAAGCTLISS